jgi:hypothetical protein
MSYDIALRVADNALMGGMVTMNNKGKTGSLGRAIAFASRDERLTLGSGVLLTNLKNGNYRPVINDVLHCGLIPKSAMPWVSALVPETGRPSKDALINLCKQVKSVHESRRNKDGEPIVLKGEKLFMFGLVCRIVADADESQTIEA